MTAPQLELLAIAEREAMEGASDLEVGRIAVKSARAEFRRRLQQAKADAVAVSQPDAEPNVP